VCPDLTSTHFLATPLGTKKLSLATMADGKGNLSEIDSTNIIKQNRRNCWRNPGRPLRCSRGFCGSVGRLSSMDGNSGTGTRYPSGTRPDGYGYGDDFLPAGGTRT
jgi:hypothetical protein